LMNVFDPVGTVYRIGGDEFLVWLDSDDDAATAQKLSILRNSIESLSLEAGHPQAAMGFASCGADEKFSPDELFRLADDRMYENTVFDRCIGDGKNCRQEGKNSR
ncbi:MAG: diguanylate cyclase, partial [Roseburia faecis]|nr:diguanylate cyclase [Roseburia faecis]